MTDLPNCPSCNSGYTYEDGGLLVCPECAHEWARDAESLIDQSVPVKDANGNALNNGDTVLVIRASKS